MGIEPLNQLWNVQVQPVVSHDQLRRQEWGKVHQIIIPKYS